jgi:hypothetical protein
MREILVPQRNGERSTVPLPQWNDVSGGLQKKINIPG